MTAWILVGGRLVPTPALAALPRPDLVQDTNDLVEVTEHRDPVPLEEPALGQPGHACADDLEAAGGIPAESLGEIQDRAVATHEHDLLRHEALTPGCV